MKFFVFSSIFLLAASVVGSTSLLAQNPSINTPFPSTKDSLPASDATAKAHPFVLAKRGTLLQGRAIKEHNFAKLNTTYGKAFFRKSFSTERYKPIGFLGNNIRPYLQTNPLAYQQFKKFRRKKVGSALTMVSSFGFLMLWLENSFQHMIRTRTVSASSYFTAPYSWLYIGGYAGSIIGSQYISLAADRDLFNSVQIYNGVHTLPAAPTSNANYQQGASASGFVPQGAKKMPNYFLPMASFRFVF